ncbi:hypothetical protein TVAG_099500 [Trichomonas vaginalis G3]|uniref:Uncharacterized protein n=1 Tax=Trichomonas vaginalis (strain ATCC PRA-98 / G3) TaxID=412133 RepID=A2FXW0_TRIV3|nr:hypothetical protein TVAGG3_0849340 [Trichomonas vaginalis G3]EAX90264.1 hypothetical protein TVAG_099500 [Trichomonas vaginalis G3]KAI5499866.1 hypothetical protein TVAGG3_0849340 [Trichomonas vaginalis G3]|eukprot:XP_001303194.1 hypothetical protein [Trichomonas vaginalis G3]
MTTSLSHMIAQIQEDFNKRLDDLELGLENVSESISELDSEQLNKNEINDQKGNFFPETFSDDPNKAIDEIITGIKISNSKKSSAKKLIEKANRQYVDLGFQRASTELSACLKQMVTQEEQSIEDEINRLDEKISNLHDHMKESFKELRQMIVEVAKFKAEKEAEQPAYAHDRGYRGRGKKVDTGFPLLKRSLRKKYSPEKEDQQNKNEQNKSLELVIGKENVTNLSKTLMAYQNKLNV